jgi:sn-glycerol 3-phosphate transport system permease protein
VTFIVVFPVYTTVIAALKPGDEVLANPLVPTAFTLDVLVDAWNEGRLGRYLFNSFVVAVIVTVAQIVTSVLAAYAFADPRVPRQARAVRRVRRHAPRAVGGDAGRQPRDGRFARVAQHLPGPRRAVPRHRVRRVPDAPGVPHPAARPARRRRIDGVGHLGFLRHVAVPLVRPTLGALALFSFLGTWNQYLWPNLVVNEADMNTVQSGLRLLARSSLSEPNLVMAGTVIAASRSSSRCSCSNVNSSVGSPRAP